jgi:hypothetical protein
MELARVFLVVGLACISTNFAMSQVERPAERPPQFGIDSNRRSEDNANAIKKTHKMDEEAKQFVDSVFDRNTDQLFEAISGFDRGNFNLIVMNGMSSSPLGRGNIVFKQVLFDFRVIKLRELLSALPKEEAAKKVKQEFSKKFQAFKEVAAEHFKFWEGDSNPIAFKLPRASHGLSATLYLSSEFCDHATFTEHYRKWLNWYRIERAKRTMGVQAAEDKLRESGIKFDHSQEVFSSAVDFNRDGGPDRLFFINLCSIRALRRGVEFETLEQWLSELNREFEIELPKFRLVEMKRFDPVKNQPRPEKIKFSMIYDYSDAIFLCDSFMEWDSQKGKINLELQDRNDQVVEIAMEWSQPNLIRKWVRESKKSFLKWSSETFGWPEPNELEGAKKQNASE